MYLLTVFLLTVISVQSQRIIESVVFGASDDGSRSCPSSELQQSARGNLSEAVFRALLNTTCGDDSWRLVVDLDMSDPSQQCPSPWTLFTSPARSCSQASESGCQGINLTVPVGTYTKVCGRVTGYSLRDPDGFFTFEDGIDNVYLDGVSLTYGFPRQHIWSLAAGHGGDIFGFSRCPCDNTDRAVAPLPPSFVGDNYFCDGPYNGALWDGQDCTSNCCTFNSPPYFTATLPAPTSDDIEVRICTDQPRDVDESLYVAFLQLYVQ